MGQETDRFEVARTDRAASLIDFDPGVDSIVDGESVSVWRDGKTRGPPRQAPGRIEAQLSCVRSPRRP